jgi:ubiquinone/menaquinone biosynthesis C-methylase UbiE
LPPSQVSKASAALLSQAPSRRSEGTIIVFMAEGYQERVFAPDGPSLVELVIEGLSSTRRGYDRLAPRFDATPFRTPAAVLERVAAHVAKGPPVGTLVDLCCGTGAVLEHLAPHADALVGVDFSPGMLAVAQARLAAHAHRVTLVEADVLAWEPDRPADLVTCFGAFGHVPGREPEVLALVHRLLRPGGRFVFVTAPRPGPGHRAFWLGHAFNAVMHVRNALIPPPFVMLYLTFPMERALELCRAAGLDPTVHPLGWTERPEMVIVDAARR